MVRNDWVVDEERKGREGEHDVEGREGEGTEKEREVGQEYD